MLVWRDKLHRRDKLLAHAILAAGHFQNPAIALNLFGHYFNDRRMASICAPSLFNYV